MRHFGNAETGTMDPKYGYQDRNGNRWLRFDGYWQHTDSTGARFSITASDMHELQQREVAA